MLKLWRAAKFCNTAELVGIGIPVTVYVGEKARVVRFAEDHLGMIIVEVHLERWSILAMSTEACLVPASI